MQVRSLLFFFFFNDTATTEIYTLSLHDALPIWRHYKPFRKIGESHGAHTVRSWEAPAVARRGPEDGQRRRRRRDRKSTRLNSSHSQISYAVFCLKKKTQTCSIHAFSHVLP